MPLPLALAFAVASNLRLIVSAEIFSVRFRSLSSSLNFASNPVSDPGDGASLSDDGGASNPSSLSALSNSNDDCSSIRSYSNGRKPARDGVTRKPMTTKQDRRRQRRAPFLEQVGAMFQVNYSNFVALNKSKIKLAKNLRLVKTFYACSIAFLIYPVLRMNEHEHCKCFGNRQA